MAPPLTGKSLILHPPTEGGGSMKRILCSLLVATLPFGSVLADAPKEKNAKVTLVYQHALRSDAEIESSIASLGREPETGFIAIGDSFLVSHRKPIILAAARYK